MGKLELIEQQQRVVDKARLREANCKAEYDAAKSFTKETEKKLNSIIVLGEAALLTQTPLFDKDEEGKKKSRAAAVELGEPGKGKDKTWRSRPVKDAISIGVVVNQLEVAEPPVTNIGELVLWMKKHNLNELKGVSDEKAAKASDQLADFWKNNPQYCG